MSMHDRELYRRLMQELARRQDIDLSDARTTVARGIAFIGGVIRPQQGVYIDMKQELKVIFDIAKRIPGMRDVVIDARTEVAAKR